MKLVTRDECENWNSLVGMNPLTKFDGDAHRAPLSVFRDNMGSYKKIAYPDEYRDCVCIVLNFLRAFDDFRGESLVWMQEWDIWSEEIERLNLFWWQQIRPDGTPDSFRSLPGHLCSDSDSEHVAALLLLALVSQWDLSWVPKSGDAYIYISHDGWLIMASDVPEDPRIAENLKPWEE